MGFSMMLHSPPRSVIEGDGRFARVPNSLSRHVRSDRHVASGENAAMLKAGQGLTWPKRHSREGILLLLPMGLYLQSAQSGKSSHETENSNAKPF